MSERSPSLPPYPGREKFYIKWRGRTHKAILHEIPQAMRIGAVGGWWVRACDGYDGLPDSASPNYPCRSHRRPSGPVCRRCIPTRSADSLKTEEGR